ncbi:MAG TPA: hypothetical protein VGE91_10670 [Solirubrobacterales bacterium]|jgi:hypothetical protein
MTLTADKPRCFDLVELVEAVDGMLPGSRGTVIIEGIEQAVVDFSWSDQGSPDGCDRTQAVPNRSMRVVESRSFDQAVGSLGSRGTK